MAGRRKAARIALVGFSLVTLFTGCQLALGLHDELSVAGGGAGGEGPLVCVHESVPPPPTATNVGGAVEFVVAMRSIQLEPPTDGELPGMNLDGVCTCDNGEGRSCKPLDSGDDGCDSPGGRDVYSSYVFAGIAFLLKQLKVSTLYSSLAETGKWSVILRVRGYSGGPEDDQVEVDWYESPGTDAKPVWNGTDSFRVSDAALVPGSASVDQPLYFDPKAYVTGGKLVASFPLVTMTIGGDNSFLRMNLTKVLLTAPIVKDASGAYRLHNGVIGARVPEKDMFANLSTVRDAAGMPLCTDSGLYGVTKDILCSSLDMRNADPAPGELCEASSFGAGFEADPVKLGLIAPALAPSMGCPMATDPLTDTCMP